MSKWILVGEEMEGDVFSKSNTHRERKAFCPFLFIFFLSDIKPFSNIFQMG